MINSRRQVAAVLKTYEDSLAAFDAKFAELEEAERAAGCDEDALDAAQTEEDVLAIESKAEALFEEIAAEAQDAREKALAATLATCRRVVKALGVEAGRDVSGYLTDDALLLAWARRLVVSAE